MGAGIQIEPIAVGWGGLVGMIGLAASSGAELWIRALAVLVAFLVGGFLSGVRTLDRRVPTAALAWVAGWVLWGAIVVILWIAHQFGGPVEPEFAPGSDGAAILIAAGSLITCVLGALIADRRYSSRSVRRRF